ncbi:rhodanese-like domain-containing protein [Vibrio marisflavi]|uniref:Thiosulfate sulfurtransferase GlpE n=1 Tax=Vibrio marisflavi CECT 7928 TaxID=634439 RepID=A0ABN8E711_9VIBR|nr:rhodanese-like domain-containing protein [Vibrio marisflavi]CAH0538854.1 Thiosulfate sulfurtransferase GlpE [Vibrio marisflavi CECT 7928]
MVRLVIALLSVVTFSGLTTEFPNRVSYPDVQVINIDELHTRLDEVNIIDVRSKLEFDVIHITGSKHIPMANIGFESAVKNLASTEKTLVFYCNGIECIKSYTAAQRAAAVTDNIEILAFDSGVLQWAQSHPSHTMLFGKTLNATNKLINKEKFEQHLLDVKEFEQKAQQKGAILIDVREPIQRNQTILNQFSSRTIPFYKFDDVFNWAQKDQTLLIYDAVGKQVRWLQYLLESKGFNNYYFLQGGVEGYLKGSNSS